MNVKLYDTTLRDGSQAEGISFTVKDKLLIAKRLDEIGIHYIEGGFPGSNPKDMTFFREARKITFKCASLVAFGATRRAKTDVTQDKGVQALLKAGVEVITIFGKSSDVQVVDILKTTLDENLRMIDESVAYLKSKGITVFYDAEHFFDSFKRNPEYALNTLLAAQGAGADAIILCDTNGGMLTSELTKAIVAILPRMNVPLGIHTHNDSGLAVANSIAAVQAGCSQVQGTMNGYGERCGNADLCVIVPALKLKLGINCIGDKDLKALTEASRYVAEIANIKQDDRQPYVGASAFAHKGGVHIDAVMKSPASYEHVEPSLVGNRRRILVSELSGRTSILVRAKALELDLEKETPHTKKILRLLQDLEHKGYQFEAAEASFELLMQRALKRVRPFFELESFKVVVEKHKKRLVSEATVKLRVKGKIEHTAAEGDGPVNALDNALRKALNRFYPTLAQMHLSDFRVRVLDAKSGTAAKVRVLIESQDKKDSWSTIGVSENIIEASWQALVDSVEYKLLKEKRGQSHFS